MFGKPGVEKRTVTPRYNHAREQHPELAHLGSGHVSMLDTWAAREPGWWRVESRILSLPEFAVEQAERDAV